MQVQPERPRPAGSSSQWLGCVVICLRLLLRRPSSRRARTRPASLSFTTSCFLRAGLCPIRLASGDASDRLACVRHLEDRGKLQALSGCLLHKRRARFWSVLRTPDLPLIRDLGPHGLAGRAPTSQPLGPHCSWRTGVGGRPGSGPPCLPAPQLSTDRGRGHGLPRQEARRGARRGLTYFSVQLCTGRWGGAWLAVLTLLCATW